MKKMKREGTNKRSKHNYKNTNKNKRRYKV